MNEGPYKVIPCSATHAAVFGPGLPDIEAARKWGPIADAERERDAMNLAHRAARAEAVRECVKAIEAEKERRFSYAHGRHVEALRGACNLMRDAVEALIPPPAEQETCDGEA